MSLLESTSTLELAISVLICSHLVFILVWSVWSIVCDLADIFRYVLSSRRKRNTACRRELEKSLRDLDRESAAGASRDRKDKEHPQIGVEQSQGKQRKKLLARRSRIPSGMESHVDSRDNSPESLREGLHVEEGDLPKDRGVKGQEEEKEEEQQQEKSQPCPTENEMLGERQQNEDCEEENEEDDLLKGKAFELERSRAQTSRKAANSTGSASVQAKMSLDLIVEQLKREMSMRDVQREISKRKSDAPTAAAVKTNKGILPPREQKCRTIGNKGTAEDEILSESSANNASSDIAQKVSAEKSKEGSFVEERSITENTKREEVQRFASSSKEEMESSSNDEQRQSKENRKINGERPDECFRRTADRTDDNYSTEVEEKEEEEKEEEEAAISGNKEETEEKCATAKDVSQGETKCRVCGKEEENLYNTIRSMIAAEMKKHRERDELAVKKVHSDCDSVIDKRRKRYKMSILQNENEAPSFMQMRSSDSRDTQNVNLQEDNSTKVENDWVIVCEKKEGRVRIVDSSEEMKSERSEEKTEG